MSHEHSGSPESEETHVKATRSLETRLLAGETKEDLERLDRYDFRYRLKEVLEILDIPGKTLPNQHHIRELLQECLSLVAPFSQREEEWLDHELGIRRGDIISLSEQDKRWTDEHPRFPKP